MKKLIIAAALCGITSYASAQSSVTLYGIIDVGVEYQNNQAGHAGSVVRETSGGLSGSRWGLKGREDLGGGTAAIFLLEDGFDASNGSLSFGGREFGRSAYVGLTNKRFGTLTLGRQQSPIFDFTAIVDPMATSAKYSVGAMDSGLTFRSDNSVKYVQQFYGFTVTGLYSFGADSTITNGAQVPGHAKLGREIGAAVTYGAGPLVVGVAYDDLNTGTLSVTPDAHKIRVVAGGTYLYGPAQMFFGYRYAHFLNGALLSGAIAGSSNQRSDYYFGGLSWRFTPAIKVTGSIHYQNFKATAADPMLYILSADYAFSVRTDMYMSAAFAKNKSGSALGLNGFGTTVPGYDQTGVVIGLRHRF